MQPYKVYYGEYSLKHWIHLLLKKEVTLPDYQRNFVWDENRVLSFMKALKNHSFIPPVVIGSYFDENWRNYILDGQQRLSSILLAYLNLFPKKESFLSSTDTVGDDDDDDENTEPIDQLFLAWTLKNITERIPQPNCSKDKILESLNMKQYKTLESSDDGLSFSSDFFENTYLGFLFIKPSSKDSHKQTEYYAALFRSINTTAWALNKMESRRSLYWLDKSFVQFFEPNFARKIKINNGHLDFARYLALLSEYFKLSKREQSKPNLAKHFSGRYPNSPIEVYIENYIYHTIGKKPSPTFVNFNTVFPDKNYTIRIQNIETLLDTLEISRSFQSIIDADLYFFGLIFHVLFLNKQIDITKKAELIEKITQEIQKIKTDTQHVKRPAALKYLNARVANSIRIYSHYLQ